MRLLFLPVVAALLSVPLAPPSHRHASPRPSTMEQADDTLTGIYVTDSVRVLHRHVPGSAVVAVNIYLLGGTSQLTPATQGIEALLIGASEAGTRSHPDSLWRNAWAANGSSSVREFTSDWSMLGFRGLTSDFDATWRLMTERLTEPQFPSEGVDVARARLASAALQQRSSADGEVGFVADSVLFAGHPYGLSQYGTPTSVAGIDSSALLAYARAKLVRSRLLVVIVGGVPRETVRKAINETLARLPIGDYVRTAPPPLAKRTAASVTMIPRVSATNYVIGVFPGPAMTESDYPAFDLAVYLLGRRITQAVREQRGLSYSATASVDERAVVTGYIYVSTPSPALVLPLIQQELRNMVNPDSLTGGSSSDNNSLGVLFQRSTSSAQVQSLAHAELLQGNYKLADNLPRRMRSISGVAAQSAAMKYFKNIQYVYAGDTTRVRRAAFGQR